jgi:hypothetical protein
MGPRYAQFLAHKTHFALDPVQIPDTSSPSLSTRHSCVHFLPVLGAENRRMDSRDLEIALDASVLLLAQRALESAATLVPDTDVSTLNAKHHSALALACDDLVRCSSSVIAHAPLWSSAAADDILSLPDAARVQRKVGAARSVERVRYALDGSNWPLRIPLSALRSPGAPGGGGAVSSTSSSSSSSRDVSEHQSRRDVERDVFVVNGERWEGAAAGYEAVKAAVGACILASSSFVLGGGGGGVGAGTNVRASDDSSNTSPPPSSWANDLASAILRQANRTESGGDGYEAATKVLIPAAASATAWGALVAGPMSGRDSDDEEEESEGGSEGEGRGTKGRGSQGATEPLPLLLVADSRAAPPIEVDVDFGPFQTHSHAQIPAAGGRNAHNTSADLARIFAQANGSGMDVRHASQALTRCLGWCLGVRASIRATTVYALVLEAGAAAAGKTQDGFHRLATVRATYVMRLGAPFPVRGSGSGDGSGRGRSGEAAGNISTHASLQPAGHGGLVEIEVDVEWEDEDGAGSQSGDGWSASGSGRG